MDINELVKGMEMTRREYEARKDRDPPAILNEFLANSEDKLTKLRADVKTAQVGDDETHSATRSNPHGIVAEWVRALDYTVGK